MIKEKSLPSCIALFEATHAVSMGAASPMEKRVQLQQWKQCCDDGGWLDGLLHFNVSGVEFKITPLEYMLISWDLPDLAWASPTVAQNGVMTLTHLPQYLKTFSELLKSLPKFEGVYKSVAENIHAWRKKIPQAIPGEDPFTPWKVLGGREFLITNNTVHYIEQLCTHWPLMNANDLVYVHADICKRVVMAREFNQQIPTGSVIMLLGFDEPTRLSEDYQKMVSRLPPEHKALIEKTSLLRAVDDCSTSLLKQRKI